MVRRTRFALLFLAGIAAASPLQAATANELLYEHPSQSLRGEVIDLNDRWSAARLLAHFGEDRRAYEVLRDRPALAAIDPLAERLEVRLLTELGLHERADSLLALQPYTGDREAYYTYYLQRARLNLDAGRNLRALDFLAVIDTIPFPAFEPYRDYLAVRSLMETESYEEACATGERRMAEGIPVSLSPHFEELLLEAYMGSEKYDAALRFIEMLKARRSRSSALAGVLAKEIDVLFLLGDTLRAVERGVELIKDTRTRGMAVVVADKVVRVKPPETLSREALLDFCEVFLRAGRLLEADRLLTELMTRSLRGGALERAEVYRGTLLYREKRYSKSYELVRDRFKDPSVEREAALLRARIFRRIGQPTRSADAYVEFARRYPYDIKAAEALYVAADLYLDKGDRAKAMDTLDRIIETYPSNSYSKYATLKMASYYIERQHYSRGVVILEKALERSGRRSEDLLYYLSDAYRRSGSEAKGDKILGELAELDPKSFYLNPNLQTSYRQPIVASNGRVSLSGARGLLPFLKTVFERREHALDTVREALGPVSENVELDANLLYLERGRAFLEMGFRDWAEYELRVLESNRRLPTRVSFELAILYDDFAMHWRSTRAFQEVYYHFGQEARKELDPYIKLLVYPIPFPGIVFENCARYRISPHLVYAMMRRESRFDSNAVSRAGAMGLMQLMPATGEQVANELGFPEGVHKNLFSPEINLTFGVWYASHLLERSDSDVLMMLSAYNAGFGNARRWFGGASVGVDVVKKVDGIDYRETRYYVKSIVEAAHIYHAYYFAPSRNVGGDLN